VTGSILPYLVAGWLFLVGLFGLVISRNLVHAVLCLAVAQSSTYVLLLEVGFRVGGSAPIQKDVPATITAVDPVVQALVLTDIVIGVAVAALLLALVVQTHKASGSVDPDEPQPLAG
jgi:multicomponent Na+:H+ antiporter subunit C